MSENNFFIFASAMSIINFYSLNMIQKYYLTKNPKKQYTFATANDNNKICILITLYEFNLLFKYV